MTKEDKNNLVIIHLDRPRFLKFGHKALKQLGTLTGKSFENMSENDFDLADLEKIIWCGLQADAKENGEILKIEQMEDLLDQAESFGHIVDAMNKAFSTAFQKTEKEKN
jgi:hypothetical protein